LGVPPDAWLQAAHPVEEPRDGRMGAGEIMPIRALPPPSEPSIAHPYTVLQTGDLIGRRQELTRLAQWVAEPEAVGHARLLIVTAIGGAGKSALAWHWFRDAAPRGLRSLVGRVWWSFYPPGVTFDHFVTHALMYVTGRSRAQIEHDAIPDREWRLLEVLRQQPFLIVLDGLERLLMAYARTDAAYLDDTVFDEDTASPDGGPIDWASDARTSPSGARHLRRTADVRAGQFLRTLAARAGASRVLITSRLVPAELKTPMGRPIAGSAHHELGGLSDEDALALWHALGATGSRAQTLPVFRTFDHHPLLIQILAGVVAHFHPDLGRDDDGYHLFRHRLDDALYYRLGAGRLRYELLAHLLPQGPGEASRLSSRLHQALVLHMRAKGAMFLGHLIDAIRLFHEAIERIARVPDERDGDPTLVAEHVHESCHFDRPSDVVRVFLSELSLAQQLAGHLWSAEREARTALAMSRRPSQTFEVGVHLYRLGLVLSARGATSDANAVFHESLTIWQQPCPHREMEGFLDACLARQALWMGDPGHALKLAETAGRLFHDHPLALNTMHGARLQGRWNGPSVYSMSCRAAREPNGRGTKTPYSTG
jgi:hypothetical protein